jgi:hypothetical protein
MLMGKRGADCSRTAMRGEQGHLSTKRSAWTRNAALVCRAKEMGLQQVPSPPHPTVALPPQKYRTLRRRCTGMEKSCES